MDDVAAAALTAGQARHWLGDEKRPLPALADAIVAISRRLARP